jgi:preprotein translocase SecE subunit
MIRLITFALLAMAIALGAMLSEIFNVGDWSIVLAVVVIQAGWLVMFKVCERGPFADFLTTVDEEATQITWPNGHQIVHAAKVGVSVVVILAFALFCVDLLTLTILNR